MEFYKYLYRVSLLTISRRRCTRTAGGVVRKIIRQRLFINCAIIARDAFFVIGTIGGLVLLSADKVSDYSSRREDLLSAELNRNRYRCAALRRASRSPRALRRAREL